MERGPQLENRGASEREWQLELSGDRAARRRGRPWTQAVLGQKSRDLGWPERGLEPTHRSAASRARVEVGMKGTLFILHLLPGM